MSFMPTSVPANSSNLTMNGDQNNTNVCPGAELSDWHSTVLPVYILLVTVLGLVLNVFVLMVFCLHKVACTVAEIYLINMAAADLILMVCLPFWAVYAMKNFDWPFSDPMCRLVTLSANMNAYSSIYFLVLISIDRYLALVHPLTLDRIRAPRYAKLSCALVWGFGLLLGVPTLVYREVTYFPHLGARVCYLNYQSVTVSLLVDGFLTVFGFIIPISIIFFCTFKIIQSLKNRTMDGFDTQKVDTQKVDQKATRLVLAVLLAFMICWVPFHVVKILLSLQSAEVLRGCSIIRILNICSHIFMYFAFFNSVLNPILYVIVGKNFQKKVRDLFKQWSPNRSTTLNTTSIKPVTRCKPLGAASSSVGTVSIPYGLRTYRPKNNLKRN